jgi:hypothetical protein
VTGLAQNLGNTSDGALLLSNSNVDAKARLGWLQLGEGSTLAEVLLPSQALVKERLVDHHIEANGGLSDLTISNNQLSLAETDRNHGINGRNSGEERLANGLTGDNSWGIRLNRAAVAKLNVARVVEPVARVDRGVVEVNRLLGVVKSSSERAENAAEKSQANVHGNNTLACKNAVAHLNETLVTQNNDRGQVSLETYNHTVDIVDGASSRLLLHALQSCR